MQSQADREKHLAFIGAIYGATAAITEDVVIRNAAHVAGKSSPLRKKLLKQYRGFEGWRRRQMKQKAKRAAIKKKKRDAMVLADKKARGKARAASSAKRQRSQNRARPK